MVRVQRTVFEFFYRIHVQHVAQVFVIPDLDLLDLMRGTETVEEMQERYAAFDRGQMRYSAQVHNLLRVLRAEHRETGLTAGVYVGMITVNVQRVGSYAASGYVDHAGQQLTGDFIHVGDHQQKALRSGKGSGQSAALQRAVHRTRSAGLGLHFHNLYLLAKQVFLALGRPFVRHFRHDGRRRDGVNRSDIGKRI